MNILEQTAVGLGKLIGEGQITAVEAVEASLAQIRAAESDINAFVTIDEEGAIERARKVQEAIRSGSLKGPLAGVPVAVKDNLCTK